MMPYTASEQTPRRGNPAAARDERRRFARRIDCDPSPRHADRGAPARGGSARDRGAWEHTGRGYGR